MATTRLEPSQENHYILINRFIGHEVIIPEDGSEPWVRVNNSGGVAISAFKNYLSNWNDLMPVVDNKIRLQLDKWVTIEQCRCDISTEAGNVVTGRGMSMMDAIYFAVVEFIKWYNLQNKKNEG